EDGAGRHETVHDAWLAALRTDSARVAWPSVDEVRELMRTLVAWRAPLVVSPEERAALRFTLVPPKTEEAPWRLRLRAIPTTRLGLISLGQAAAVFPPLRALRGRVAELSRADVESFLRTGARELASSGFDVVMPAGVTGEHVTAEAELTPTSARAPMDGTAVARSITTKLTIRVDGEKVTEREIQFLLDQGSTLVFFRNRWIEVDRYTLREALRALQSVKGRKLEVAQAVSFALGTGRVGRLRVEHVKAHGWLRGLLNELRGEEQFRILPQPKGLKGTLRDYQLRGVSWLVFLTKWGFGPCLADDMGLGKTIQTIAFILHLVSRRPRDPVLVVAPVSVTTNWVREFKRFAPGLKVLLHQGSARATGGTFLVACRRADVVVTGYSLLVKDYRDFSSAAFSALVLDEAQTIKNADTRAARAARALEIPMKVALTGTPFENSANDLWSLEEFLNPGLLGERRDFEETFTRSIRADAHGGAAAKLRRLLEPFMLRRLKTDPGVAAELGAKREVREYCTLAPEQRRAYEDALAAFRADAAAEEPSHGRILALLTELKLICDGEGKIARLDELLEEMFANGESCLVFTQYAKVGRLLRAHLQEQFGRLFPFLHGGLSPAQREGEIAAFNADPEPNAFILSLKAGGFGLNLTRATHVIHFDRWWNPAVENQATDRAYRIGQTKTVFVHLFICAGTLEDHVDELLESKRYLANEVVAGGESFLEQMNARALEKVVALE
ncbi:MAG: DEAD/DEAH box helicase, partial [Kiritimatiellia bacterium]